MPFSHSPDYPYTLGGTFQYTDANNIENGVAGAYTELESITANDGTALPSSNGPFTLANFINYLTSLIKSIVGGSNWYSSPPTSLTSLNTGKVSKAGDTFTGKPNVQLTLGGSLTEFMRYTASDGKTYAWCLNTDGTVVLRNISDGVNVFIVGPTADALKTGSGATIWHANNDGPGSGLEADKLRSAGSVGIKTNDNGTTAAVEVAPDTGPRHLYLGGRDSGGATHFGVKVNSTSGLVDFIAGQPTMNGGANPMFYGAAGLTGKFSAQSTAPSSPADGDLWLDTSTVLS